MSFPSNNDVADEREDQVTDVSPSDENVDPYRMENPYTPEAVARRRRRNRLLTRTFGSITAVVIAICCAWFVWDTVRPVEIFDYATEEIVLVGLTEEPISVTPEQLVEMTCVRMMASGAAANNGVSKAGIVSAYGPLLETLLEQYDYEQTDFRRIKFYCKDGYTVVLRGEALEYDIVLSVASGKDALVEAQRPLRLVIPDEQSGKWAYGVVRIEFDQ